MSELFVRSGDIIPGSEPVIRSISWKVTAVPERDNLDCATGR